MIFGLVIKEEAYQDLQDAYDYYEEQRPGLGDEFIEEVKEKLDYIKKYPLHFPKTEKDSRQTLVDRFPYLILYELEKKEVIVYSFFHTSQDPQKKIK
jgi:plasmid stabilization system protein ParE